MFRTRVLACDKQRDTPVGKYLLNVSFLEGENERMAKD